MRENTGIIKGTGSGPVELNIEYGGWLQMTGDVSWNETGRRFSGLYFVIRHEIDKQVLKEIKKSTTDLFLSCFCFFWERGTVYFAFIASVSDSSKFKNQLKTFQSHICLELKKASRV